MITRIPSSAPIPVTLSQATSLIGGSALLPGRAYLVDMSASATGLTSPILIYAQSNNSFEPTGTYRYGAGELYICAHEWGQDRYTLMRDPVRNNEVRASSAYIQAQGNHNCFVQFAWANDSVYGNHLRDSLVNLSGFGGSFRNNRVSDSTLAMNWAVNASSLVRDCYFESTTLVNTGTSSGIQLSGCEFSGADIQLASFTATSSLQACRVAGTFHALTNCDSLIMERCDLRGAHTFSCDTAHTSLTLRDGNVERGGVLSCSANGGIDSAMQYFSVSQGSTLTFSTCLSAQRVEASGGSSLTIDTCPDIKNITAASKSTVTLSSNSAEVDGVHVSEESVLNFSSNTNTIYDVLVSGKSNASLTGSSQPQSTLRINGGWEVTLDPSASLGGHTNLTLTRDGQLFTSSHVRVIAYGTDVVANQLQVTPGTEDVYAGTWYFTGISTSQGGASVLDSVQHANLKSFLKVNIVPFSIVGSTHYYLALQGPVADLAVAGEFVKESSSLTLIGHPSAISDAAAYYKNVSGIMLLIESVSYHH